MTVVLPIASGGRLVGSAVLVAVEGNHPLFATALHLLGDSAQLQIALPPHGGNCQAVQSYPLAETRALVGTVLATDPFADLAIVGSKDTVGAIQVPSIAGGPSAISVGADVVVLGYPFAPIGSFLETWVPSSVSALALRNIAPGISVNEMVLAHTAHPGSSGSAVVGRKDGVLYGIVRGTLAPPEIMKIGDIPVATDTSVTFASSAHYLNELLVVARQALGDIK